MVVKTWLDRHMLPRLATSSLRKENFTSMDEAFLFAIDEAVESGFFTCVLNVFVAILSKKAERHFETLSDGPD